MERGEQVAAKTDNLDTRLTIAAHHEAGHIVIAAAMGLRLRPEGIMVDKGAWGLACFYKEPDESDESKESIIVATVAGYLAQKRFCEEHGYSCPLPDDLEVTLSPDSKEARGIETNLSRQYLGKRTVPEVHELLQQRAAELVLQHWPAIEAVAREVASKSLAPLKPLKSGTQWSDQTSARSLPGDEVVKIVERFGIKAVCVTES
ncbi:MAG: hypothetical protein WBQ76_07320 [Candidatus Korobacteraceae bacterium]